MINIECRDAFKEHPLIGGVQLPLARFAIPGGHNEWVELFHNGHHAGKLHVRTEFVNSGAPVVQVGAGIAGVAMQQPMMQQPMMQ
jgi:hypothetical protein